MGKWQRNKGAAFEREIANEFNKIGIRAKRSGLFQTQSADAEPDVTLLDLPNLWIECKKGIKTYPLKALKQAKEACSSYIGSIPVAICRDDHEKSIVTMELDFFMLLLSSTFPDIVTQDKSPEIGVNQPSDKAPEIAVDEQLTLFHDPKDP